MGEDSENSKSLGEKPKCQIERVQACVIEGDQTDSTKPEVLMDAPAIMKCNR